VSLLELHHDYSVAPVQCFEQKDEEQAHFNSLAYYSIHSHLAGATEAGTLVNMYCQTYLLLILNLL
jgi:hypothetical protein